MKTNIRYILLCALRDKLFVGLLAGIIGAVSISAFLGGAAFIEEKEMMITFAAASARLIIAVGLIVFVCFHLRTGFDTREIDVMLSRPISRSSIVLSYWLGFALVGTILVVPTVAIIALIGVMNWEGYISWAVSLLLESWFVVAIALFTGLMMKSAVSAVMSSLGIYVLSRMMVFFVMTAESGTAQAAFPLLRKVVEYVAVVVPRLDFYAKTEWLVYGLKAPLEWQWFVLQTCIYVPFLLAMSIFDFKRKQF